VAEGVVAEVSRTTIEKSTWKRPRPKPPSETSWAIIDADCGWSEAASTGWVHAFGAVNKGSDPAGVPVAGEAGVVEEEPQAVPATARAARSARGSIRRE
jgi:hypothetical protein